ncbi:Rid family hydrolase [Leifsonia naganoensis]|uniref:Enamine deaminase RidA (YjgF/YER057c/UK114 family) n=1 Tax=Leifsonia naganoensis TaxID=150025 RepID=A0A853DPW8_9MICO|nr:enamine deaminase RidA (YjgF/YER057c/UK114 family) [Leifsonia naganoensis]
MSDRVETPVAAGDYAIARVAGGLVYTAGMTPRVDGTLTLTGRVGESVTEEQARAQAGIAAERAVAAAESVVGGSERLLDALSLTVYIAADASFTRLSQVADGASEVIAARFVSAPLPVRAAVGVASLPGGATVEVQLVARLADR